MTRNPYPRYAALTVAALVVMAAIFSCAPPSMEPGETPWIDGHTFVVRPSSPMPASELTVYYVTRFLAEGRWCFILHYNGKASIACA